MNKSTTTEEKAGASQNRIQFVKDREALELCNSIANRAVGMAAEFGVQYDKMTAVMDIEACHANGCPLQLCELLKADDENFAHDVFGIRRHINRKNGQLEDCFLPRFAHSLA